MKDYNDIYDVKVKSIYGEVKVINIQGSSEYFTLRLLCKDMRCCSTMVVDVAPDIVSSETYVTEGRFDAECEVQVPKEVWYNEEAEKRLIIGRYYRGHFEIESIDYTVHDEITTNCRGTKECLENELSKEFDVQLGLNDLRMTILDR